MAVSRALRRLVRVLELEEEQYQISLETAMAELHRLQNALEAAGERERGGRQLISSSVVRNQIEDRLAGIEQTRSAAMSQRHLVPRIADAAADAAERREEYLAKRTERRQAETLVDAAQAQADLEASRRNQSALDEWYLNRRQINGMKEPSSQSKSAVPPRPLGK